MPLPQIVIIEDDAHLSNLLGRLVHRFVPGAQVATFRTAEETLPTLQRSLVALLIVDYHLPGVSGVQLIHQLRRAHVRYPILLLTGHQGLSSMERLGATEVLFKPFELATLRTLLTQMLSGGWEQAQFNGGGSTGGRTRPHQW